MLREKLHQLRIINSPYEIILQIDKEIHSQKNKNQGNEQTRSWDSDHLSVGGREWLRSTQVILAILPVLGVGSSLFIILLKRNQLRIIKGVACMDQTRD